MPLVTHRFSELLSNPYANDPLFTMCARLDLFPDDIGLQSCATVMSVHGTPVLIWFEILGPPWLAIAEVTGKDV